MVSNLFLTLWLDSRMIMFAKCVDMITCEGGFQSQQREFAFGLGPYAIAGETNPLTAFFPSGSAVAFESKFLHLGIIGECSKVSAFNVVRCAINSWRIHSRHQLLCMSNTRPSFYNFLKVNLQCSQKLLVPSGMNG
jgi:hypothetical protein